MTGKKILSGLFFFLLISQALWGQEPVQVTRSENKVILEGKIYYIHIVKAGQTLFSIARAYNTTEKEIVIENPGAGSDLMIGQVLKIPEKPVDERIPAPVIQEEEKQHILKEGETLYAVSRLYGCTVDELIALNPGLDINDIPVGYALKIPTEKMPEVRSEITFDEDGFLLHKVKRGETLYSISRAYGVSIREIRSENTELGWGGPRIGDVLRIPQPNTTITSIFTPDTLLRTAKREREDAVLDSLESLPAYSYDELAELEYEPERMYRIAYLIPFNYVEMEPLDSLLKEVKSELRRERIIQDYRIEAETPGAVQFLEFLEGSLLAIDSLTDAGVSVEVQVFDTKRSMSRTRELLEQPGMEKLDLIIGPFYNFNLEVVSEFSRKQRIPVVTPFSVNDSLLRNNPYLFQTTPSYKTEYDRNALFIGRSYDHNIVFVHNGDSSQMERTAYYKRILLRELEKYAAPERIMFKEVIIRDGSTEGLVHSLNSEMKNLVILPSEDEAFASLVATKIYYELANYDIRLFGSSYWAGFNNIEISYPHALDLVISHSYIKDYNDIKFLNFLKEFRDNYMKEPLKYTRTGSNYGLTGYNLSLFFISALQHHGPAFILHLDDYQNGDPFCRYAFERVSPGGGYENRNMQYYHYNKDLDIEVVQLPEHPETNDHLLPAGDDPLYFRWSEPKPDTTNIGDD
jgi:LysM repeat protein